MSAVLLAERTNNTGARMPNGRVLQPKLVSFDRVSDALAMQMRLPIAALALVKLIAKVPHTDPEIMGSYPLTNDQAEAIAAIVQMSIDTNRFIYFVESD